MLKFTSLFAKCWDCFIIPQSGLRLKTELYTWFKTENIFLLYKVLYLRSIVLINEEDTSFEQEPKAPRLHPPTQAAGATDKL